MLSDSAEKRKNTARNFIFHLHPVNVPKSTLKFTHTFGLGGMSALLIVMLAFTGILLRFFYQPFPAYAYESVLNIQYHIIFGGFLRNIHYWSATFLLIIAVLHLLRVFFTRAFLPPRQFNWIIGLLLLFLIMLSSYTGYLLPWDQLSYWAITVSTNMLSYIPFIGGALMHLLRGGNEVGAQTLLIYYNLHTGVIPLFIAALMAWHFWRVRKAGGVILPGGIADEEKKETAPVIPDLIYKEFVVALSLIAFIFTLALFFNAPLLAKANPALSPDPVKAPWYFLGIQELLLHFDPLFSVVIIPFAAMISLFLIPYYNYRSGKTGVWFISQNGKKLAGLSAAVSFFLTVFAVLISEYLLHFERWFPDLPLWLSNGLFPFALTAVVIGLFYYWLKRNNAETDEIIQSLFVFFLTGLIVLTLTALWFRGMGMLLTWPF
jgi:quinol-cytochrome oxidoreductase complex cytochrome b subunit